jgi:hypothetical protein
VTGITELSLVGTTAITLTWSVVSELLKRFDAEHRYKELGQINAREHVGTSFSGVHPA